jgi:hypothetical protein
MVRLALAVFVWSMLTLSILAEDNVRVIAWEGTNYVCFDRIASQIVLDMRLKYPLLGQANLLLKDQVKVKEEQIIKWQSGIENLTAQMVVLTALNADLQQRITSANVWYKSNILWAAISFVAGVGITIGVVTAVNP